MTFRLTSPAVLSRSEVFRDETLRTDLARQEAGWPSARLVVVDDEGRTPVDWTDAPTAGFQVADAGSWDRGGAARLRTRATTGATPTEGAVLLGELDGVAYWAVRGKPDVFA
ncbi:MAG TPA: NAD(+) diphosphatase, partial [Pseudonocardia sp.]|nr:NAD(+) diphosphatase [Pseudonocardia sp.]